MKIGLTKAEKENAKVFRGLGVRGRDKGEWIYGQIVAMSDCKYIAERGADELSLSANRRHRDCEEVQIAPSTLSEWTGFTDCNGVKIFEGDIIAVPDLPCNLTIPDVEDFKRSFQVFEIAKDSNCKVIGNIYEEGADHLCGQNL